MRSLTGATLSSAIFSASFGALYYFLTLYTQEVLHYSAIQSGLSFLPLTISAFLGAKLINKMITTVGVAGTIASGMTLGAIGFMLLTQLSATGSAWGIIPGTAIIGIGQAFLFTTMYIAGSSGIDTKDQGVASAIVSTGQQIGGPIGLAVSMAIISVGLSTGDTLESLAPIDLNKSIHTAFIIEAVIALLGILVALTAFREKRSSTAKTKAQSDS
jgi:MFS family permease